MIYFESTARLDRVQIGMNFNLVIMVQDNWPENNLIFHEIYVILPDITV